MLPPLTDNPVTKIRDDAFGFRPYIEELHAAVAMATPLPITVGVFGPWGTGKSTFLRMWEDLLSFAPETRTLWFNPWKYDQKVQVWAALIQSLLAEIHLEETLSAKATKMARTAAWLGLKNALTVAGFWSTAGIVNRSTIEEVIDGMADRDADFYRDVNRFELDFAELVDQFIGPNGRLVVFVDDLDRCAPSAAVDILEALKLFVGDARCVFVLAMDFDVLVAAAGARFGQNIDVSGTAYLEKLVQLPFFLPEISFPLVQALVSPQVGDLAESAAFWDLVQIGFAANPRRIKRFINVLTVSSAIATRQRQDYQSSLAGTLQLAELLIIRGEHREFFNHLLVDPGAWRRLEDSPAIPLVDADHRTARAEVERERDPTLARFLANDRLVRLMMTRPGSTHEHVVAPNASEVSEMIETIQVSAAFAVQ